MCILKKKLTTLLLALIFLFTGTAVKTKAEIEKVSVDVVINGYSKVIAADKSSKINALEAAEEVLKKNGIKYETSTFSWGGTYISSIEGIKEKHFGGWDGWLYAVNRKGKYVDILTGIDGFNLMNGDKLIVYYGDFSTLAINKIDFSTDKPGESLELALNNTYIDYTSNKPVIQAVNGVNKVLIDGVEYNVKDGKIILSKGLSAGKHTIEVSDFGIEKIPSVVADKIEFAFPAEAAENSDGTNSGDNQSGSMTMEIKDIDSEIAKIKEYLSLHSDDPWAALTLKKFGIKAGESYILDMADYMETYGIEECSTTDLEKLILNLTALGYSPYNFNGEDIVKEVLNRDIDGFLINDSLFALLVYNYANVEEGQYKLTKEILIKDILDKRLKYEVDGKTVEGWALSGDKINPDITGAVLSALAPFNNDSYPMVKEAIKNTVNSISLLQNEKGYLADNFGIFSESLSFMIVGLTAVGENPEGVKFTKKNGNLISAFLSFKGTEGQIKHSLDGKNDYMATEQALRALISLKEYKLNGKYDFYKSDINAKELPKYDKFENSSKSEDVKEDKILATLPQTGVLADTKVLSAIGLIVVIIGIFIINKKDQKNI
jgi:hypothetical protein